MYRKKCVLIVVAAFVALGLLTVPSGASEWELSPSSERAGLADISVQAGVITLTPRVKFESIRVTISGPDGIVYENRFTEAPIAWYVEDSQGKALPDGRYRFELRFSSGVSADNVQRRVENPGLKERSRERSRVVSGGFSIENGVVNTTSRSSISAREVASLREPKAVSAEKGGPEFPLLWVTSKIAVGFDDAITPLAALHIQESSPTGILLEERVGSQGTAIEGQWRIRGTDTNFTIGHDPNDSGSERENIVIEEFAPANQLYMDSSGRIGFGTSTPAADFHIASTTGAIRIEDTDNATWQIEEAAGDLRFSLSSADPGSGDPTGSKFEIEGNGNIGIGTTSPEVRLQIRGGSILLDNTESLLAERADFSNQELFTLDGNDDVVFNRGSLIAGQASHLIMGVGAGKRFEVRGASNTPIMRVMDGSGRVAYGNFFPSHPLQMASGAHVTAGGVWTNASSRDLKTDIHPLSATQALEALNQMEPVLFRYKSDESDQNVGFIAEDVPALIATPDRKGMSAMDVVAVLTAVVQEQRKTIGSQNQALDSLLQRVNELERRLSMVH